MSKGAGTKKGRSLSTYNKKIYRLKKLYNVCPKIQAKYSLDDWLSKVTKPREK